MQGCVFRCSFPKKRILFSKQKAWIHPHRAFSRHHNYCNSDGDVVISYF